MGSDATAKLVMTPIETAGTTTQLFGPALACSTAFKSQIHERGSPASASQETPCQMQAPQLGNKQVCETGSCHCPLRDPMSDASPPEGQQAGPSIEICMHANITNMQANINNANMKASISSANVSAETPAAQP